MLGEIGVRSIGDLGERSIIELIMKNLTPMPDMPVSFWDDVSAVKLDENKVGILKTDMLVWKTDVPRGMTPFQAARKAVVMNFSDLASKGVRPLAFLVSLGLPRSLSVEVVDEMAKGFNSGSREYGAYVIGGDTNEAEDIIVGGMAYGVAELGDIIKRDGAKPGDLLAVTGGFGDTSAAFKILLEGYEAPTRLRSMLVKSVYMPKARVEEGIAMAESGSASASIDSSDGLALSLHDLSRSSHVGFKIQELPISPKAAEFAELHNIDPFTLVLYGGEEYEIVFTIKPDMVESAHKALRRVGCNLIEIGQVIPDKKIVYARNNVIKTIKPEGWEHFKG